MKRVLCTTASCVMLLASTAVAEVRFWTSTGGQLIEAEMIGVNVQKRAVKVRLKDGKEFEIAIDNLSTPDKAYAKEHWAAMQNAPATPAAASAGGVPDAALNSLPPRYRSRLSPDARLKAILDGGGTPEVEAAVVRSLTGFKASQNPDGSWGRGNKSAMTGFVLQCYLGHGETADSTEFGDTVLKGLLYHINLAKQNPHGLLTESWVGNKGGAGTYEHAIATVAIGEAYVLAKLGSKSLPGLREAFEKAVEIIISQQTKRGSWSYGGQDIVYNPGGGADLSLANWHFQALQIAKETSLQLGGLDACIKKSVSYIDSMQTKQGGFGGPNRDAHYNQWSLSGGAAAGHIMLSGQNTPAATKGVQFIDGFLKAEPPDWNANCNLYCWYGYGNALSLNGGAPWKDFSRIVMPQIIAAQEPTGSFKRGRPNWPAGDAADATYRQALCTLILETFYR
ncbi:MAG: prenyltransferase/squalene oxidase repeat-containing protein [Prosthecobacter sp.]|uniref:prenyltransferase/squalene oxidase repeat-containing protein n=1 Tax=Prosthecobacter sp. TaxID=1965333 RepID=UPI0038FE757A